MTEPRHSRRINWSLPAGLALVTLVVFLAWLGPELAPRDPLQENAILFTQGTHYVKPPVPAFTVPGFPLGADEYGRDIFSRLLWAVRPTLTIVLVVAALRLVIGLVIGLAAGWSNGRTGRVLESLISGSLALPVLFVALFTVAVLGPRTGVWAFAAGLALTGWAESARITRLQARTIKSQLFVEAARALGAESQEILARHVLPHIASLVWILLSFEVSSTLLSLASLGFLGYFINSAWIQVGDWTMMRTSGMPELGQMLSINPATAARQPWSMLFAGGLVFITVLGFNLVGEGLRLQAEIDIQKRRKGLLSQAVDQTSSWLQERIFDLQAALAQRAPLFAGAVLGLVILVGGYAVWRSQNPAEQVARLPQVGGSPWSADQHDPQGSLWTNDLGPENPALAWSFKAKGDFSGGPVIDARGMLYLAATDPALYALNSNGEPVWQVKLPASPVGYPALSASGSLYVVDATGGVSAYTGDGQQKWVVHGDGKPAISSPVVDAGETVYYATQTSLLAVNSSGRVLWKTEVPTYSINHGFLRLSADGNYLVYEDTITRASDGRPVVNKTFEPMDFYVIGTDANLYETTQETLNKLSLGESKPQLTSHARWNLRTLGVQSRFLSDSGLSPAGNIWLYYSSGYEYVKLVWLDGSGNLVNTIDFPYRPTNDTRNPSIVLKQARLIAFDKRERAYVCGVIYPNETREGKMECRAVKLTSASPTWRVGLGPAAGIAGGAVADGRLYLASGDGTLYALEDK